MCRGKGTFVKTLKFHGLEGNITKARDILHTKENKLLRQGAGCCLCLCQCLRKVQRIVFKSLLGAKVVIYFGSSSPFLILQPTIIGKLDIARSEVSLVEELSSWLLFMYLWFVANWNVCTRHARRFFLI